MASGLIALLDDVAALAKVAAASLDDIAAHAGKASAKAAGVVIDDAAVTPRYAVGFAADRELPIVGKIALGSLREQDILSAARRAGVERLRALARSRRC
jgi:predicted DNA repair protein MutK